MNIIGLGHIFYAPAQLRAFIKDNVAGNGHLFVIGS
jgi:hypothetical protein